MWFFGPKFCIFRQTFVDIFLTANNLKGKVIVPLARLRCKSARRPETYRSQKNLVRSLARTPVSGKFAVS